MADMQLMDLAWETYTRLRPELRRSENALPALPAQAPRFRLDDLLASCQPIPPYSLVLGVCPDGLPMLLDLENPNTGAVLTISGPQTGKTALLQAMVISGLKLNSANQLRFGVITRHPEEWSFLRDTPTCAGCFHWYDPAASELLLDMARLVENRRNGRRMGAAFLMVMDEFDLVNELDDEVRLNLQWLLHAGPQNRVWTLASLEARYALQNPGWIRLFPTRLFGQMDIPLPEGELASFPSQAFEALQAEQFLLSFNENWYELSIPVTE